MLNPGWLFDLRTKWKLRNQWTQDVDRDLVFAASKGLENSIVQLIPHATYLGKALAFWQASFDGHARAQRMLLDSGAPKQAYLDGMLSRAAEQGDLAGIQSAIDRGAELHNNNNLPLMLAVSHGREAATQDLLSRGANPNSAFNIVTLRQLRDRVGANEACISMVERVFFADAPKEKPLIGFDPRPVRE